MTKSTSKQHEQRQVEEFKQQDANKLSTTCRETSSHTVTLISVWLLFGVYVSNPLCARVWLQCNNCQREKKCLQVFFLEGWQRKVCMWFGEDNVCCQCVSITSNSLFYKLIITETSEKHISLHRYGPSAILAILMSLIGQNI